MTGSRRTLAVLVLPFLLALGACSATAEDAPQHTGGPTASATASASPTPIAAPPVPGATTLATLSSAAGQSTTSGIAVTQNTLFASLGCRGEGEVRVEVTDLAAWTVNCSDTPDSLNSTAITPDTAIEVHIVADPGLDWVLNIAEGTEEYTEDGTPIIP